MLLFRYVTLLNSGSLIIIHFAKRVVNGYSFTAAVSESVSFSSIYNRCQKILFCTVAVFLILFI